MRRWGMMVVGAAAALAAAGPRASRAQTGFSGTITYRTHGPDSAGGVLVESQKGSKVRIEGFGGRGDSTASRGGMIYDQSSGSAILVLPAQRVFVRISREQLQAQADTVAAHQAPGAGTDGGATLSMTRTGRSQTIAGVRCDVYRGAGVTGGTADTGEVCVASGVGLSPFDLPAGTVTHGGAAGARLAALRDVLKGGRGVLESSRIVDGKPVVDLEATRIDRTPPPDSTFIAPAGYAEVPAQMSAPGKTPAAPQHH